MKNLQTVKWGIIGCGDVTEVKSGPAFNRVANSELVAVMRRDAAKAEDYARRHKVPKWYSNAGDLIHDPEVNAVYVATPPDSHEQYTLQALQAGKPVYVEKPMARTLAECGAMVAEANKRGLPLLVAYYRRSLPAFLQVKAWIDEGAIGAVRAVSLQLFQSLRHKDMQQESQGWRVDPAVAGGGYFFDLASHQLDLLDYFLGPISSVNGIAANQAGLYKAEDIVSAHFVLGEGIIGTGIWCFTVAENSTTDTIEILGEHGKISFPCFGEPLVKLENSQGETELLIHHPKHIQEPLIEQVVRHLRGEGNCPSTGKSALRTNKVLEAILSAYYSSSLL